MDKAPHYLELLKWSDEDCRAYLERRRWPNGPICPKCGATEPWRIVRHNPRKNKVTTLFKCRSCRRQFTSTIGTIFEDSHIPLSKWFAAVYLMCSSKKAISALQLKRLLWGENQGSYKTAWFMCHRIREAMIDKVAAPLSGTVEADETYIGPRTKRLGKRQKRYSISEKQAGAPDSRSPLLDKQVVFGLLERGGKVRAVHIDRAAGEIIKPIIRASVDMANTHLMTDEAKVYQRIREELPMT